MRALDQISARGTELSAVFASSAEISVVVASFSVVVALMTARAVVLYDFPGKQLIYFLTILPFVDSGYSACHGTSGIIHKTGA